MLNFFVLSSGSKANSLFVSNGLTRVLLDCGLSFRRTVERLAEREVDIDSIDALVISHEHSDHIAGVERLLKRHPIPVFVAKETYRASRRLRDLDRRRITFFDPDECFGVGDLEFQPFRVPHDAADPVAFRISSGGMAMAVVTDLGVVTPLVRKYTRGLHALVLESNHEPELLSTAPYTELLKARIRSDQGHLSNPAASGLVSELYQEKDSPLRVLVAAHISENSNRPELATNGFQQAWSSPTSTLEIVAASVYHSTPLFRLGNDPNFQG